MRPGVDAAVGDGCGLGVGAAENAGVVVAKRVAVGEAVALDAGGTTVGAHTISRTARTTARLMPSRRRACRTPSAQRRSSRGTAASSRSAGALRDAVPMT